MIVELRPHIGQMSTAVGVVDVEHDQWIVLAGVEDGKVRQVGYLGHKPGSKVQPIVSLPESVWSKITAGLLELPELSEWSSLSVVSFATVVFPSDSQGDEEEYDNGDE